VHLRTGARTCDRAYLASCFVDDDLPAGPYVFLEVDDTGRGMDDETRQRMFDPFFSSKATGRGLGLAAVLGIIRGHNGAIRVDSALGRGTTITVLFPATGGPADASLPTGDHEPVPRGSGSVMVVDDEPGVRSLVEQVLERAGYAVYCACDGLEAVEFMREHPAIDLVLLDVTMPRLDGRDTFRQLREIAPELRVILMSGYDEQSAVPGLVREPSSTFLQKPFRPSTLLERVRRMLAGDGSPPAP
jgi:CheY-like chemotaxis protein